MQTLQAIVQIAYSTNFVIYFLPSHQNTGYKNLLIQKMKFLRKQRKLLHDWSHRQYENSNTA